MISFIVAMDKNRVIGKNNQLPWNLPADLAFFKRVTMGHPIVMGRKTHEAIGRVLPGRENVIVTRDAHYQAEDCTILHSVEEVKEFERTKNEEIFVIGGAEIFKETFTFADRLYLTVIEDEFDGDTYFPEFNQDEWKVVSKEKGIEDEKNPYHYYFIVYDRKQ